MHDKQRDRARDFNNLNSAPTYIERPFGIWSDGDTAWVSDLRYDKAYSFNMPPPSSDARLSSLTVSPEDIIGFDAARLAYEVGVASTVEQATVAASAADRVATVDYSGTDADTNTEGHQVTLTSGRNAVTITVTAEDGDTTTEYTISINRGVTTDYGWKAVDDFDGLIAAGNTVPYGVWSDGTTIWVTDELDGKLYAYRMSDRTRDAAKDFDISGVSALAGIWSDGTTMWVGNGDNYIVYAYRMSDQERDEGKDFDTVGSPGRSSISGIWSDGDTMWMASPIDDKLFAYRMSDQERDEGKDFNTLQAAENTSPSGIWSDGTTMWVGDSVDGKFYAYRMTDRTRDEGQDFNTLAAVTDNHPAGIWSDGDTMWVVVGRDKKVYSYNMPPSADATLSALTVSPVDIIGFDAERESYEVGVASAVTEATVAATANDLGASVEITPGDSNSGVDGHQVELTAGQYTDITIRVTAESGATKDYTLKAYRGDLTTAYAWRVDDDINTLDAAVKVSPRGIWSNGTYVWVADIVHDKLFAYDAGTYARVHTQDFDTLVAAGNVSSNGIWSDGTTMWMADLLGGKLYAYRMTDGTRDAGKDFNTLRAAGNDTPSGIWSDGVTMWVTDDRDVKIYAYRMSDRTRDAGKDFNTLQAAGNQYSLGIWSDGATMWVSDSSDDKLYAYRMSDQTRDAGKDFDTLAMAGNSVPAGMWSDETIMWVTNGTTGNAKVYSYNMPPSGNGNLSAITLAEGSEAPTEIDGFSPYTTEHAVTVGYRTSQVTVAGAKMHSAATGPVITPPDADANTDGHQVDLSVGDTEITLEVTAEDASTRTYTLTITRVAVSADATLSALTVSPVDIIGFDAQRESYEVGVASTVTEATVAATANDLGASVEITPGDSNSGVDGHQVELTAGQYTDVTIRVTAESGATKDYTLKAYRGDLTTAYAWRVDDDFDGLIAAGNRDPYGIWSDGTTMWVADSQDGKIYAYRMSDRTRDAGKDFNTLQAAGNTSPYGIWSDGTTMWVSDAEDDKLYAYRMTDRTRDAGKDFNTLQAAGNQFPYGIWSDGTTMWVSDAAQRKLFAYRMSDRVRDEDQEFDTDQPAGNVQPSGIWSDGDTMWVADLLFPKLYAYRMSDRTRDQSKYFNTLRAAGNQYPPGVWSDGRTMWVSDASYDKIYSYNTGFAPPAGLQGQVGDGEVTVTWDDPDSGEITGYQYRVSADGGSAWNPVWTTIPGSNARTTTYTVRGLTNNVEHVIQLRAMEDDKRSGVAQLRATPLGPPTVPNMPGDLEALGRDGLLTVIWRTPIEDSRVPITSYDARYRRYGSSDRWQSLPSTHTDGRTFYYQDITGLTNRRPYEVRVAAANRIGTGSYASAIGVPQAPPTPPGDPADADEDLNVGALGGYWTDGPGTDESHTDPDGLNLNVIFACNQPQSFRVFWADPGPANNPRQADEYEAHMTTWRGAGAVSHRFRPEYRAPRLTGLYATVQLYGPGTVTVRVRGRFGDDGWGTWSPPMDFHCLDESARPASTQQAQQEPEGNRPASGKPAITGIPTPGETLGVDTSAVSDPDGLTDPEFTYQWRHTDLDTATDSDIPGATNSTYTLVDSDEGKGIKVRIYFTDDAGNAESLTSFAYIGSALPPHPEEEDDGEDTPPEPFKASVHDAPQAHDGETGFTFELRFSEEPEEGFSYRTLQETFTVANGKVKQAARKEPPGNVRWTITITPASTSDVTITLPVTTDCEAEGAICTEDGRMLSEPVQLTIAALPNRPATGAPAISGAAQVGNTLMVSTSDIEDEDGTGNATFTYQWLRNDGSADSEIAGETGTSYELSASDLGKSIKVRVNFTDDAGNQESLTSQPVGPVDHQVSQQQSNSLATGQPTIGGAAQVGGTLTADTSGIADEDGLDNATFTYQWVRNDGTADSDIQDATGSTYTLVAADQGETVKVRVSFNDDAGNAESLTSEATAAVAAKPNSPATGSPTINGTAQVGETLTADTSGIADTDGISNAAFSYQWLADDADIVGSSGSSYTLTDSDEGKAIKVRVSFADDAGNVESLASVSTAAVAGPPSEPLTASPENPPDAHDGESAFTFELRFSEEFELSYKTLRDHAFTVTGGTVTKAQRTEKGSNVHWRITVNPKGAGDVTIILPVTEDCGDQGAICTDDGRMLSNRLELTVSGP